MRILFLLFFSFLSLNASADFDWLELFQRSHNLNEVFEDYQAAESSWNIDGDYRHSLSNFIPRPSNNISSRLCGNRFYAAHPFASTKLYHYAIFKRYDLKKLPATSYACRTTSNGKRKFCLAAGSLKFVVISDTFFDSCGNYFRGYWPAAYNTDDENMGTLLAKGRTMEPIPNSPFRHDYRPSNTYEVQRSTFLYLSPLLRGDKEKITNAVNSAKKHYNLVLQDNIFVKTP